MIRKRLVPLLAPGSPAQQFRQLPGVLRTCVATQSVLDNERLAKSHRQPLPHQAGKSIGGTSVPAAMTPWKCEPPKTTALMQI
jgi:hypothetical protein